MQRPFVILAHVAHPAILEGFLPAAHTRGLPIVVITDHAQEHRRLLATSPIAPDQLHVIECDVFNPLAVIETLNAQARTGDCVMRRRTRQPCASACSDWVYQDRGFRY